MSYIVQSIVERRKVGSAPKKSVLLYMAARASDDGSGVWTSKASIAKDTELAKRTVQYAILDMVSDGLLLKVGKRPCKTGETDEYALQMDAISALESTRATDAPVQDVHPPRAPDAPLPVQDVHPNNPLITLEQPKSNNRAISEALEAWASTESVASFLAYRKGHKSKALTLTGAKRLANHLQQIFNAGFDPSDALGMAEERGWASVEPDWYFKTKGQQHVKSRTDQKQAGMAEDPALKQIARLAGLR